MNVEVKLEWRSCRICGSPYRVMGKSQQKVCSIRCESRGQGGLQRVSRSAKELPESVTVGFGKSTRNSELTNKSVVNFEIYRTPSERRLVTGRDTTRTRSEKTSEKKDGPQKTENTLGSTTVKDMQETEQPNGKRLEPRELEEIQPTASNLPVISSDAESFHSIDLINSSANELHRLMLGLNKNTPDPEEGNRNFDPEKVQTACICAKQITELLRLKLDIFEAHKGMK